MSDEKFPPKASANRHVPFVDWYNEQVGKRDEDKRKLDEFLTRNPDYANHPTIVMKIADLAARNSVLQDFKGVILFSSEEAVGKVDDLSDLFSSEGEGGQTDVSSQDIDKP